MALNCENCSSSVRRTRGDWTYADAGLDFVILANCVLIACIRCDYVMPQLPDGERLKIPIAERLVRQSGRFSGTIVRFLRKALGMTSDEFAALLNANRVEVSRWENDHVQMSGLRELQIRLEVIDKLLPRTAGTTELREEVISRMTREYSPSTPPERIIVDVTPYYPASIDLPPIETHVSVGG